jgi:FPC/CPF motif-containing protein YcgG
MKIFLPLGLIFFGRHPSGLRVRTRRAFPCQNRVLHPRRQLGLLQETTHASDGLAHAPRHQALSNGLSTAFNGKRIWASDTVPG